MTTTTTKHYDYRTARTILALLCNADRRPVVTLNDGHTINVAACWTVAEAQAHHEQIERDALTRLLHDATR